VDVLDLKVLPMDPFADISPDVPTQRQDTDAVNAREELLLKAKDVSRRIAERFWKAMDGQGLPDPYNPAPPGAHAAPPADGQARSPE
jgi:hypothetical protein